MEQQLNALSMSLIEPDKNALEMSSLLRWVDDFRKGVP